MRSLLHVVRGVTDAGKDLPEILPQLTTADIRFRRGQLALIAGQPGRGKTLLALWYAVRCGEPVLYISADSDMGTVANRAAAVLMNKTVSDVKDMRESEAASEVEAELAALTRRLRIDPDPNPTIDGIYEEVLAFVELMGTTPSLIVIDVLMNVHADHDNEWTGMRDAMSAFHTLARESESAVVVLHHTSEDASSPTRPGPMKSIMGKVNQLPELILTVAMDGDHYNVAAVKNRDGSADPKAESPLTVYVDAPSMSLFNTHDQLAMHRSRRTWT